MEAPSMKLPAMVMQGRAPSETVVKELDARGDLIVRMMKIAEPKADETTTTTTTEPPEVETTTTTATTTTTTTDNYNQPCHPK